MYSTPLVRCFNELIGALLLDSEFGQKFMENRLEAIRWYNNVFAPHYQQRQLDFSTDQLLVINSIRAKTLEEFLEVVARLLKYTREPAANLPEFYQQ